MLLSRKLSNLLFLIQIVLCTPWLQAQNKELPVVAITQIIEHGALNETRRGIIEELEAQNYNSNNIQIIYQNAQGNLVTATQIAQKFASQKPAVIVALATTSAQTVKKATALTKIPVVFASVTDPIGAHIVANADRPEANVTGTSNFIETSNQLEFFKKVLPSMTRLGIVYNPGDANSVILLKKTQEAATTLGIQLFVASANRTTEVSSATKSLVGKVDAIFINNDNTSLSAFDTVTQVGMEAKIPIFCSDTDMVQKKALAALGCNQYQLGRQTGAMVVRLLRGEAIANIPIELPSKVESYLNAEVAEKLGITFSEEIIKQSTLVDVK
ncbi:MAG: hypothetical protein K0S74_205 [Chlamydiales bacterium]|jgi:putative ABC transport system substrate-binding protein|nr:hypothetical protein [Chlamydiales bacterium]